MRRHSNHDESKARHFRRQAENLLSRPVADSDNRCGNFMEGEGSAL